VRECTAPEAWQAAFAAHPAAVMDPAVGRLLVVAAHPDDETLGAGGFLRAVHAAGGRVRLVVATDGEAAFPRAGPAVRAALARTRRDELDRALGALGLDGIEVHRLGLPDSGLADVDCELVEALRPLAADADACLAPWVHDPHPDHAAAGRATLAAAPVGAHRFGYPIWTWPWGDPDDPRLPWPQLFVHRNDPARPRRPSAGPCVATRRSWARAPTAERPSCRRRCSPTSTPAARRSSGSRPRPVPRRSGSRRSTGTAAAIRGAPAPAGTSGASWPCSRPACPLPVTSTPPSRAAAPASSPGCSVPAADAVTASDFTPAAVESTRAATAGMAGVAVAELALPDPRAVPEGVDLVVCSEVLYYLGPDDLAAVVELIARAARPGADIALLHWSGQAAESPQDAWATHRAFLDDPRFSTVVEHVDAEFLLHVVRCG